MKFVAGLVQSGSVKKTFSLQLMAVQCVRRWLRCSAPALHLSVLHQPHPVSAVHQPHPIPSGIGSYSPSGKGCFRRSCILRSPPEWALQAAGDGKARGTFRCGCWAPGWRRSGIAVAAGRMTFVSAGFTREEEFSYSEDMWADHFVLCYIGVG